MAERFLKELTDFKRRAGIDSPINTPSVNPSYYRILDKIGQGGMSVVYKALDERLNRLVAIKVLHPFLREKKEYCERFFLEAKTVAQLHHPNIVQIFDISNPEIKNNQLYIVCELVDGITLSDFINKYPFIFEVPELASMIIWQVLQALSHAHKNGVIHRDIKEENIMISCDGNVKLLDFGIAKLKGSEGLTKESTLLGSIGNIAPEVILGEKPDHLSDIFSLSIVFYFLLTLKKPFNENSPQGLLHAIIKKNPIPIQKISPHVVDDLASICETGLNKDKKKRFLDAEAMAKSIESALKNMGIVVDNNKMSLVLKDPTKYLESYKKEILLKIKEQINYYERNGEGIKALSLKFRIDHKNVEKKTSNLFYRFLLGGLSLFTLSLSTFLPFYEPLIYAPLKEKILVKEIEEAPTILPDPKNDLVKKEIIIEEKKIEGRVNIAIWPFADVYVDNKQLFKKTKYLSLKLPLGEHILRFEHPYAENIEKSLNILDQKTKDINIVLEKTKPAKLVIKSNVNADIAIDNVYKGTTFESLKKPIIISLPDKTSFVKKEILIKSEGFKPFHQNIELTAGETRKLDVVLNYLSKN